MDNRKDEHKEITIIVNTREKEWGKKDISYEEVIKLAFGSYDESANVIYAVTYSRGEEPKHEGSLSKGMSVKVKKGMVFNVTPTDKS